jgi:CRISPR/Cas system-associated exonuclease Cas4 (RecB family)
MAMLEDIAQKVIEHKAKGIKNYPHNSNRASEAGHPCERYLVLARTHWNEKPLHDVGLEFIFQGGNMIEKMAFRELEDAGYEIVEQQKPFEWKELELTGRLDAKLRLNGSLIPLEIKGLQPWDAERLNTIEDFFTSKKTWIRKYPAQLMLYMLMDGGSEEGIFYIKNKQNYRPKAIPIILDYEYAEGVCKKLERVNQHVKEGTLPDQVDDPEVCQFCSFLLQCLPDIKRDSLEMIEDPELEEKLIRREELALARTEYERLDKEISKIVKGKEKLMVGDFLITGKETPRKGYMVEDSSYWAKKIVRLVPGATDE